MGRPKGSTSGRKVALALQEAGVLTRGIGRLKELMDRMSNRQRRLFVALCRSQDELEAIVEAGMVEYLGIAKKVRRTDGRGMMVASIRTKEDLAKLDRESYERLLRIARSAVRSNVGEYQLAYFQDDVRTFLELIAPEAAGVVFDSLADQRIRPEVRLKAAFAILDRV